MKLALWAGHAGAAGATLKRRGSIPRLDGAYTRRQSFVGRMGGRISASGFALQELPPHPSPFPLAPLGGEGEREPIFVVFKNSVRLRKRELICAVSKPEFDAMLQVGVARKNNSASPLSLRERARVRGF